jgi:uncharacterized protein
VGNDLLILVKRGDIQGMSFTFRVKDGGDRWNTDEKTGVMTRTLLKGGCERLYDVTYTCDPAYIDTTVAQRSLAKIKEAPDPDNERLNAERKRRALLASL